MPHADISIKDSRKGGVAESTHPEYNSNKTNWRKFRLVSEGGKAFIDKFLKTFSQRESIHDFEIRKQISYSPSHAKAAVFDIKNAIFQRMSDIIRDGGVASYQSAIRGEGSGVDREGNTMNSFIGRKALPEMLFMGKVGIYVDRDPLPLNPTKAQTNESKPYIYHYTTEDIRNWAFDSQNELSALLLRDHVLGVDKETGLATEETEQFRLLKRVHNFDEDGKVIDTFVTVQFFDSNGDELDGTQVLRIPMIPFCIAEVSFSLLEDIADYQVALLNLASSDMNYALRSNFPFYTEQFNPNSEFGYGRPAIPKKVDLHDTNILDIQKAGEAKSASQAKPREINVGTTQGRRYQKDMDRPGFIHPSPEPLLASMQKQEKLQREIRQLVNLNLSNIEPKRASAESKQEDVKGLEAGLSYIGMELEYTERKIAKIWAAYEGDLNPKILINYPSNYSLRSDEDRRREAKEIVEFVPKIPSKKYQKEATKQAISIMLSQKVDSDTIKEIKKEIDSAKVIVADPDVIIKDHQAGLIGDELASEARLYPEGESERAQADKAKRAKAVLAAQTSPNAGARGVSDLSSSPEEDARMEKEANNEKED